MNYRYLCILIVPWMALYACSNKQIYENIRQNQQLECQKGPESQYDECMARLDESYESYTKKRTQDAEHK